MEKQGSSKRYLFLKTKFRKYNCFRNVCPFFRIFNFAFAQTYIHQPAPCSTANRQIVAGATGQMIDDLPPSLRHIHCATVISFQSDSDQD